MVGQEEENMWWSFLSSLSETRIQRKDYERFSDRFDSTFYLSPSSHFLFAEVTIQFCFPPFSSSSRPINSRLKNHEFFEMGI